MTKHQFNLRAGAVVAGVFLGAASALRAQLGVAPVVAQSDPSLPSFFRRPWTRRVLLAAAAVELVADKLPSTPSRLEPSGLIARLGMGALAAGPCAHTRQAHWLPIAALGAATAGVAAKVGHDVRAELALRAPDPAIAVGEDAVAFALAVAGASR